MTDITPLLVELEQLLAATTEAFLPMSYNERPDYAEVAGPSFQAMTMKPQAFDAVGTILNALPTLITAYRAERMRADGEYSRGIEDAAKVADAERDYRRQCQQKALNRREARDFETMAIACVHVASAIRSPDRRAA